MSIFTAALVTAFNSEFQMEDKLDGFKVGVMQDTEEHGTALLLGAQVAAYDDYDDLLHDLQFGVLEIAMVDVLFAVDVLGNLTDRQLVQGADIHRIYTHGFLIQDSVDKAVRSCVAKYAIQHRDVVNQHIMTKESKFQKKRDNRSGATTRRLVRSEIFVVYVALSIWTILFVMGVIWQLARPLLVGLIHRLTQEKITKCKRLVLILEPLVLARLKGEIITHFKSLCPMVLFLEVQHPNHRCL
ncbi:hypothetical protein CAPTEDRAFT_199479 [Capitella teleta]|uniref:Uncharacterized protein n=1 Tax=Capitella teleta TaxID=283909 RepID=R7V7R2_CAPTE|nr:hypothetical protein CAPTEDRAFT_199479 [Capitella teleta]|eukprot:ELU14527.1 hypothetical protein CAPTEDRAFT_199479 [Capitella teleta]